MNRGDLLLLGCGGAGNRQTDAILNIDRRFLGYFINSSITDIQSLDNYDDLDKNYLCISQNNGAGRDRNIGKRYANKRGFEIIDTIQRFDQKTVVLISSFGGGSGSSIISILVKNIENMKREGLFDKNVILIGILPTLDSPDIILQNTLDTWNEIINSKAINSMIFIDNNNTFNGEYLSEDELNERFAELFDSIFEIPSINGTKFDNRNLSNILNDNGGCTYIYDLPSGCSNVEEALKEADKNSVLAKLYKTEKAIYIDEDTKKEKIKCSYLGVSLNDENYSNDEILDIYHFTKENYYGYNEDKNLLILSGMLPPLYSMQVIRAELEDRNTHRANQNNDFSNFTLDYKTIEDKTEEKQTQEINVKPKTNGMNNKSKAMKKAMKKNFFDIYS